MVEVTWWLWRGGGDVAVVGAVVVLGGPVYRVQTKTNIKLVDRRKKTPGARGHPEPLPLPRSSFCALFSPLRPAVCLVYMRGVMGVVFGSRSSL